MGVDEGIWRRLILHLYIHVVHFLLCIYDNRKVQSFVIINKAGNNFTRFVKIAQIKISIPRVVQKEAGGIIY